MGIQDYKGTAEQNITLMKALRSQTKAAADANIEAETAAKLPTPQPNLGNIASQNLTNNMVTQQANKQATTPSTGTKMLPGQMSGVGTITPPATNFNLQTPPPQINATNQLSYNNGLQTPSPNPNAQEPVNYVTTPVPQQNPNTTLSKDNQSKISAPLYKKNPNGVETFLK